VTKIASEQMPVTGANSHPTDSSARRYRLHYFPESGNSYKLALMLTLCGQRWEPVWTDFMGGQTRSPQWREAVNEMGEIPVLEEDGRPLTQTGAILLRLAERHGRFGTTDEAGRFEVLRWLLWDNHKLTSYMATYRFMRAFTRAPSPEVLSFFRGRLDNILAIAERQSLIYRFARIFPIRRRKPATISQ
jgi:glutathione S-transferase